MILPLFALLFIFGFVFFIYEYLSRGPAPEVHPENNHPNFGLKRPGSARDKWSKKILFSCLTLFFIFSMGALFFFLKVKGVFEGAASSPYKNQDICFAEDQPGATDRFTTFTPVRCSNPKQVLGPAFGADHATLNFKDVDRDGKPEMIVESSAFRCKYSAMFCYDAWRFVIKIKAEKEPAFEIIEQKLLEDLTLKI